MIAIFVGPSGSGKTFFIRHYLLPSLLSQPKRVTMFAPEKFKGALIDDPISRRWPKGQYPGVRYRDVSAWRASPNKSRLSCFDAANVRSLCKLALELGDVILGFDEIDFALPARTVYRDGADGRAPDPEYVITQKGRHEGIFLFGGCRRLHNLHVNVRSNVQIAWFANLTEPEDRNYAADMARVGREQLSALPRPTKLDDPRYFVEWRKETDHVYLVHLEVEEKDDAGNVRRVSRHERRLR